MWLEKAPRGSCAGQNRQRLISRLVNTSRFTEKGEGVDYPLKTRLSSSMALCAGLVIISSSFSFMFVIAHQTLAHTHLSAFTIAGVVNGPVNLNDYYLGVFLSSLEKR
ncbi:hypothetical protein GGP41_002060 [Bipolaris sorokiniana]|uniref:Uncharacterized protein n=1 Tax=Cochliobolus sativus TaxID=45130 RepID=A0A8H5ZR34_COCSA|nr:hypothetical protein GGP41_002060 [Bipolaris sorokiniana]